MAKIEVLDVFDVLVEPSPPSVP
ncbi:unnamed protein product, partial [Rotaria sordida]